MARLLCNGLSFVGGGDAVFVVGRTPMLYVEGGPCLHVVWCVVCARVV
jgi:hypothetical protein